MFIPYKKQQKIKIGAAQIRPVDFTEYAIQLPIDGTLLPFSFKGRRYFHPIYNTAARKVLLMCGRQVEKSTTLGNITLAYSILRKHFRTLFVSPTQTQTKVFSKDRLDMPVINSRVLSTFARGRHHKDNVLYKRFVTQSEITLRYAFLHADRTRGISADMLLLDELQDISTDIIPVIEETLFTSSFKIQRYSGTPKSLENTIAYYWENYSTQNEWVIPCDHCGGGDYRYWNIIGEKNIGSDFLVCSKCGKQIYPMHPSAQWASMNPDTGKLDEHGNKIIEYEGYRIPQLISPRVDFTDVHTKKRRYTRALFFNEVLGLGYDSGERPLTKAAIKACCKDSLSIHNELTPNASLPTYMGIDWGSAENSFTVMTLGRYMGGKFHIFFAKRFTGDDSDQERMFSIINHYARKYSVKLIGCDYGGGFQNNDRLVRMFGARRVVKYQYCNTNKKLYFEPNLQRFMVSKTPLLMDIINAINRGDEFVFPRWEDWEEPFAQDMVNIYKEWNEARSTEVIQKLPGKSVTDDTLHSVVYCFLASMIMHPRPDIVTPTGEEK